MKQYLNRIISASLSPNAERDDVWLALSVLASPWTWMQGGEVSRVQAWFSKEFHTDTVHTFNSGRAALHAILYAFGIGVGDEVIVQAFTCVAVPNSVLWAGAVPVYADIDDSYNLDPQDVEKKITKKTKAIIIQHTLGIPAQISALLHIAKKYNLYVIEDCAHALGATHVGKRLGQFGNAAFFSFGRDKSLSSVWGGAALIHTATHDQKIRLQKFHETASMPSMFWIMQQLIHPIVFSVVIPLYRMGIGKVMLVTFQKLGLLSLPVYAIEKTGGRPSNFPSKYPNALARILLHQLEKLDIFTAKRKAAAKRYAGALEKYAIRSSQFYVSEAAYLRFPLLVEDPGRVLGYAKAQGILLGNWYQHVIDPRGVVYDRVGYEPGSCPNAEFVSAHIINMPTLLTHKEIERVITCLIHSQ